MSDLKKQEFKISEDMKKYRKEEDINSACEILSKLKGKSNAEIKDILRLSSAISDYNCKLI